MKEIHPVTKVFAVLVTAAAIVVIVWAVIEAISSLSKQMHPTY